MQSLLLALATIAALPITAAAQDGSDREREGLVGRVSAVRSEYAAETTLEPRRPPTPLGRVTFDVAGNYAIRDVFDDYGFPVGKETFDYSGGRLTGSRLVDPKGRVLESRAYAYGSSAKYERVTITDGSGQAYEERYKRGPGERIEAIRYVSGKKEGGTTAFIYRTVPDKPDEAAFFRPGGGPATAPIGPCLGAHRVVYRYADGRISERALYEADGSLKRTSSFKYDGHGNVIEEARTEGPMKSLLRYEYRYDDRGNWTRRKDTIRYDVGAPPDRQSSIVRVTTRTITYF